MTFSLNTEEVACCRQSVKRAKVSLNFNDTKSMSNFVTNTPGWKPKRINECFSKAVINSYQPKYYWCFFDIVIFDTLLVIRKLLPADCSYSVTKIALISVTDAFFDFNRLSKSSFGAFVWIVDVPSIINHKSTLLFVIFQYPITSMVAL